MFPWLQAELKTLGFVKSPYERNAVGRTKGFLEENVRLEKSSLYKGSYMLGIRVSVPQNQGVLGYTRPAEGNLVILDYWMGPDGIKPVEWSDSRAWAQSEKDKMLETFIKQGLSWLEYYSNPKNLVDQLVNWQDSGVPCPPDWPQGNARKIPLHNLYIAVLFEYLGEVDRFKEALKRWIDFLDPEALYQKEERIKCIEYLARY